MYRADVNCVNVEDYRNASSTSMTKSALSITFILAAVR